MVAALIEWGRDGRLLRDVAASVGRVVVGFTLSAVTGVAGGLTLGLTPWLRAQCLPVVDLLRPVPPIAWIPLAILWFGLGDIPAYFLVFLGAFFPIFTSTLAGVLAVQTAHVNIARCLGAGKGMIVRDVVLPAALPSIVVGLRTGMGVGWMSLIAAEMVGAQSGLGYAIQAARILLRIEDVVAGMIVIGLLGFLINRAIAYVGARVTPWSRVGLGAGGDA